jgi:hypothetical protein
VSFKFISDFEALLGRERWIKAVKAFSCKAKIFKILSNVQKVFTALKREKFIVL